MDMQVVLNISQDDNEDDTSGDDMQEEELQEEIFNVFLKETSHSLFQQFLQWKRQSHNTIAYHRPFSQQQINQDYDKFKLKFYLLDCDSWASSEPNPFKSQSEPVPSVRSVTRLYGVDEFGNSLSCFVHGVCPYFWAVPSENFTRDDIPNFKDCLNHAIIMEMKKDLHSVQYLEYINEENPPVSNIEYFENPNSLNIFEYFQPKTMSAARTRSIYETPTRPVPNEGETSKVVALKIYCVLTKFRSLAAKMLKRGLVFYPFGENPCKYDTYEDALNPTVRFLTSLNISCCTWLELELAPGKFYNRDCSPHSNRYPRQSYAQVELDIDYDDLCSQIGKMNSLKAMQDFINEEKEEPLPTLRILSFDIECMTRPPNYEMPQGGNDRVLQIGNVLKVRSGEPSSLSTIKSEDNFSTLKVIFTLGTCDNIPDAHVFSFNDEISLLEAWRLFVLITDPDVLTGYNINKFDIPFMLDRSSVLGSKKFPYLGRTINLPSSIRGIQNHLKRMDKWADKIPLIQGRIIFDMYPIMKQNFRNAQPFTLANMSKTFLEFEEKGDVKYTEIFKLQNTNSTTRNRLAKYCLQDAWLALRLMLKTGRAERESGEFKAVASDYDDSKDAEDDDNCHDDFLSFYCRKAVVTGSLRYLVTKSPQYNQYLRLVRKQKNPSHIFPSVSNASPWRRRQRPSVTETGLKREKVRRMLFTENEEESHQKSSV